MNIDKRYQKYLSLGGIKQVGELYKLNQVEISEIARVTGTSRQTVWNDLNTYFSQDELLEYKKIRMETRIRNNNINSFLNGKKAKFSLSIFNCVERELNISRELLTLYNKIFEILIKNNDKIYEVRFYKFNLKEILFVDNSLVSIRYGKAVPTLREYTINRYRFGIAKKLKYDYYMFFIFNGNDIVGYLFEAKELRSIRSLNLKFKEFTDDSIYNKNVVINIKVP